MLQVASNAAMATRTLTPHGQVHFFIFEPFGLAGGTGTLVGPVVGAIVVVLLKNYVSAFVERWTMLLGFVFLMIVLFMPDGLVPGFKRLWMKFARRRT